MQRATSKKFNEPPKYTLSQYGYITKVPPVFTSFWRNHIVPNPYIYQPKGSTYTLAIEKHWATVNPFSTSMQQLGLRAIPPNQSDSISNFLSQPHARVCERIGAVARAPPRKPPSMLDHNRTYWEEIEREHQPESLFASETDSMLHLLSQQRGGLFAAKLVTMTDIIRDTKALLIGIQSESYTFDADALCFRLVAGITVAEIAPVTFSGIVEEFLECGTCYRRLASKYTNSICLKEDGFVYRVIGLF